MRVAILNYSCGVLDILDVPDDVIASQSEFDDDNYTNAVDKYLAEDMGYHLEDINYMYPLEQINFVESK